MLFIVTSLSSDFLSFPEGDSKTLMIVQVAPTERHVSETLCSLKFAKRVRTVELGLASRRVEATDSEVGDDIHILGTDHADIVGALMNGGLHHTIMDALNIHVRIFHNTIKLK